MILSRLNLLARFCVSVSLAFLVAGVILSAIVLRALQGNQEREAAFHAQFVTNAVLAQALRPADLRAPVTGERAQRLRRLIDVRLVHFPVVRVKVWRRDGTILLSDEPRIMGRTFVPEDDLEAAFGGTSVSGVTDLAERENRYERPLAQKLLETYVPLQLKTDPDNAAPEAVVEIYQDYAHVQRGINRVFLRLIAALVGGLAFAAFLGFIAVRGSLGHLRRISGEVEAIQAGGDLSRRVGYESRADEVGRLAQAFDRMLARLSDAFRSQQQFVADASHELRTPITVIKGQLEHVTQELQGSASDLARPTALALEELERMRLIVEDLLLLARLDEGLPLDSEPVEVELVAREALLRVMLLEGRELHVQVEVSEGLYARSDQERLLQVLTILVANSVQHAGDEAEVTISARRKGDNVLMEVSDTGVGIPGKELPHVFKRLYRGSKARAETRGGAGLGLAIAASLVQAMGGSIDARSTPGEGSTFTVLLPLADTQG